MQARVLDLGLGLGQKYRMALKVAKARRPYASQGFGPWFRVGPEDACALKAGKAHRQAHEHVRERTHWEASPAHSSRGAVKAAPHLVIPYKLRPKGIVRQDPRVERLPCTHSGTYADDCICERVRQHKCYIVATCDRDLRRRLRKACAPCSGVRHRHRWAAGGSAPTYTVLFLCWVLACACHGPFPRSLFRTGLSSSGTCLFRTVSSSPCLCFVGLLQCLS